MSTAELSEKLDRALRIAGRNALADIPEAELDIIVRPFINRHGDYWLKTALARYAEEIDATAAAVNKTQPRLAKYRKMERFRARFVEIFGDGIAAFVGCGQEEIARASVAREIAKCAAADLAAGGVTLGALGEERRQHIMELAVKAEIYDRDRFVQQVIGWTYSPMRKKPWHAGDLDAALIMAALFFGETRRSPTRSKTAQARAVATRLGDSSGDTEASEKQILRLCKNLNSAWGEATREYGLPPPMARDLIRNALGAISNHLDEPDKALPACPWPTPLPHTAVWLVRLMLLSSHGLKAERTQNAERKLAELKAELARRETAGGGPDAA